MKVLMIHNSYCHRGGEDVVVEQEAELLKKYGHEMFIYRRSNKEIKGIRGIFHAFLATFWSAKSANQIKNIIETLKPDVIHVHNTWVMISFSCFWVAKKLGVPIVYSLHNYRNICPAGIFFRSGKPCEECGPKLFAWPAVIYRCYRKSFLASLLLSLGVTLHKISKTMQKTVDVCLALSDFSRNKFLAYRFHKKILLKRNSVVEPDRQSLKGKYALYVGRLSEEKGILTLLAALPHLKSIPIKIVGGGPLSKKVEKTIQEFQIFKTEFLGPKSKEEVNELLSECCFLIFPSEWYEVCPLIILEAFSLSKPVIAARIGAMAEIIEEDITGCLYEPGNAFQLVEKVRILFSKQELCLNMGKKARQVFLSKYREEINVQNLIKIYKSVLTDEGFV